MAKDKAKEREEILAKANMLISSMELKPEDYKLTGSNEELKEVLATIVKDADAVKAGSDESDKDGDESTKSSTDGEDSAEDKVEEEVKPLTAAQLNANNRKSYNVAMKNTAKLAMKANMDSLRESDKK